ncbi:MAG: phospholipase D family protein [Gammaproteobacteria bacterium]
MPRPTSFATMLVVVLTLMVSGCTSLPETVERVPSHAISDNDSTSLGRLVAAQAEKHPGQSGFALVKEGRWAFTARVALANAAERTLDAQYYIWEEDGTGFRLAQTLLDAADRGVRVRVLLDDLDVKSDEFVASLDAHPFVEIRVFNPSANRSAKGLGFLSEFGRLNHRMHNKVMITDGAMAIVGGRNIGDHYFQVDPESNFRDLDIMAAGPVVTDISATFDYFWNGAWSFPIASLVDRTYGEDDLAAVRRRMGKAIAENPYPYSVEDDEVAVRAAFGPGLDRLTWAPGQVVADDPASLKKIKDEELATGEIMAALRTKLSTIEKTLLIESAYFVLTDESIDEARRLVDRGVRVRILTNSLVSNDVLAAHAGYEKRRKDLLETGVELYELRPDSGMEIDQSVTGRESKAGLHTKAFMFDDSGIFVGSFNLDPRSANLNTEFGIYVESPALAADLAGFMDDGVSARNAYRVELDSQGDLVWIETRADGTEIRYDKEPTSTWGQRVTADFIRLLPVESQL